MELPGKVGEAIDDLKEGKPVLIYDWPDREDEVDMVYYAGLIDVDKVYKLRSDAGGMVCFATRRDVIWSLGVPMMLNLLEGRDLDALIRKGPRYGQQSPLALMVNHIRVRTGISDSDRSLTTSKLHRVVSLVCSGNVEGARELFYGEFYAPGHVPILAAGEVRFRSGHTDLSIALTSMAGLEPSVVFAEMLGYGDSLGMGEARRYAEEEGLTLITGPEVLEAFRRWNSRIR